MSSSFEKKKCLGESECLQSALTGRQKAEIRDVHGALDYLQFIFSFM